MLILIVLKRIFELFLVGFVTPSKHIGHARVMGSYLEAIMVVVETSNKKSIVYGP